MNFNRKGVRKLLGRYFNLLADKEDERAVVEQVKSGIAFRGTNLWILIFAILIASLGLNVNSTAVIIGAMLISPLMGPIIGMGFSVGVSDMEMLKQSLKNYGVATLISVVTATFYFWVSPLSDAQSELLARTSPTLYDVLIAFCGGAAGVLALTTKSKGQVIPGVAIATALMPPLCTAGYGLATAQWTYFFGAFYLFFINTVFIATATFLGVKLLRFRPVQRADSEAAARGRKVIMTVVLVTLIPAVVLTVRIVQRNVFENEMSRFVKSELYQGGTQILDHSMVNDTLLVVAVGAEITDERVATARERMPFYGLGGYGLNVIQANGNNLAMMSTLDNAQQANAVLNTQLAEIQRQLAGYTRYDTLSARVAEEVRPLFPEVKSLAVGFVGGKPVAVVGEQGKLSAGERERLVKWLRARVQDEKLEAVFN